MNVKHEHHYPPPLSSLPSLYRPTPLEVEWTNQYTLVQVELFQEATGPTTAIPILLWPGDYAADSRSDQPLCESGDGCHQVCHVGTGHGRGAEGILRLHDSHGPQSAPFIVRLLETSPNLPLFSDCKSYLQESLHGNQQVFALR